MIDSPAGRSRPRVLVLSFSPISRDPRVLRQINQFSQFADVVSCGFGSAPPGVAEHVQIPERFEREPWRADRRNLALLLGLRRHRRLYFDSEKIAFLRRAMPIGSMDVVVANDVLAVPLAMSLKPKNGVHADLHEYAPRQGEDNRRWRLLIGPFMDWACRKYVTQAASVSTVSKGIAEEYASVYKITEPAVVPNAPSYDDRFSPTPVEFPFRMIHIGIAGRVRRIENMIDAVARANVLRPGTATFDVILAPGEHSYIEELAVRAEDVPDGAVRVLPPVEFDQIVPTLSNYDLGFYLCPPANFNMMHALPNKFFEFVQARLAVVIGPSPEMKHVAEHYGFGLVAQDFGSEAAAQLLAHTTAGEVAQMKQRAHEAARALSAEDSSGPWLEAVRRLVDAP